MLRHCKNVGCMLTLNEAIEKFAAAVLRDHTAELAEVYRKHPMLANQPRKNLHHIVEHAIVVRVIVELKRVRNFGFYPSQVENWPAIQRIHRRVFQASVRDD